jgi:hypothetical protein
VSALCIELAAAPIEAVAAELAVVAFFELEAPVAGSAGRVDWRLCGALSRLALQGELRGARGEAALVPSGGGIAAPRVMVLGLGPRADFDAEALAAFSAEALDRGRRLRAARLALGWPARLAIPAPAQADALLEGLAARPACEAGSGLESLGVVASASEAAALAEALRARSTSLPQGLALAAPLLPTHSGASQRPPGAAELARLRVK